MEKFDLVLFEKPAEKGLTTRDIIDLLSKTKTDSEVYPIEIYAKQQECSAMGFITTGAANKINFDYEQSGLNKFIGEILDDVNKESKDFTYKFMGIKIFMGFSNT